MGVIQGKVIRRPESRMYLRPVLPVIAMALWAITPSQGMTHEEFVDFVDKYGELHHNGSVWRAYAYFEAPNRAESCQIQRPNDPSKIFVDSVPDVWPKADTVPIGTMICNCFAAPSTTPNVLPDYRFEPVCRTVKQTVTVDWDP